MRSLTGVAESRGRTTGPVLQHARTTSQAPPNPSVEEETNSQHGIRIFHDLSEPWLRKRRGSSERHKPRAEQGKALRRPPCSSSLSLSRKVISDNKEVTTAAERDSRRSISVRWEGSTEMVFGAWLGPARRFIPAGGAEQKIVIFCDIRALSTS